MAKKFIVEYTTKNIMDKLEEMHKDIAVTNGKVKLHTKLFIGVGTSLLMMAGWIFYLFTIT